MSVFSSIRRRSVLRGATLSAVALPLGGLAPLRSRTGSGALEDWPICHVATDPAPEPAGNVAPTQLKLTWNANAICTVGVRGHDVPIPGGHDV